MVKHTYGGVNQPRKFVQMNVDCWEKMFDCLPLRDILSMGQTCQRIHQIGGYYFRENFHGITCNLHKFLGPRFRINNTSIELERADFLRFVDTVSVYGRMENLEHYLDLLGSVTTLRLSFVNFNGNDAHGCEHILNNIETLFLWQFHKPIARFMSKIEMFANQCSRFRFN